MNDLDLCLKVVSRPIIALHSTLNISETVTDRGLVPKDHQQEMTWGYQMVTCFMTSRDPKGVGGSTVGYPSDSLASCQPCESLKVVCSCACHSVNITTRKPRCREETARCRMFVRFNVCWHHSQAHPKLLLLALPLNILKK